MSRCPQHVQKLRNGVVRILEPSAGIATLRYGLDTYACSSAAGSHRVGTPYACHIISVWLGRPCRNWVAPKVPPPVDDARGMAAAQAMHTRTFDDNVINAKYASEMDFVHASAGGPPPHPGAPPSLACPATDTLAHSSGSDCAETGGATTSYRRDVHYKFQKSCIVQY